MQIRIDLTTPRTLRGNPHYDAAIQQLGRWSKQTDSDLIPGAQMPREIAAIAEYVDDCDEQASRNEHVYRADIEIVRSPDEGNLYWGRGYGQEYRGGKEVGETDNISCGLEATYKDAAQRCTRIAHAIARTIRLTGKTAVFSVGPLQVRMQLGSYKGCRHELAAHLTITPTSKYYCEPKWVDEPTLRQAAQEWADVPDDIRCPLYAAIIQQIAALEKA